MKECEGRGALEVEKVGEGICHGSEGEIWRVME